MSNFTDEEINEYKEAFAMFDKNGDGLISKNELAAVLKSIGRKPTDKELRAMIAEADTDSNGKIDFDEFLVLVSSQISNDENLMETFRVFDRNNDGYISRSELKKAMADLDEKLTDEEVEEMIQEADLNGDGKINYEEFLKIMRSK